MVEVLFVLLTRELPNGLGAIHFIGVAGQTDNAGRKRRCDAGAADAGPATVDADVNRDARRAAGLRRYIGDAAVVAVRVVLPWELRDSGTADRARTRAAGARVGPERFAILRALLRELRAADCDDAVERSEERRV